MRPDLSFEKSINPLSFLQDSIPVNSKILMMLKKSIWWSQYVKQGRTWRDEWRDENKTVERLISILALQSRSWIQKIWGIRWWWWRQGWELAGDELMMKVKVKNGRWWWKWEGLFLSFFFFFKPSFIYFAASCPSKWS